MGPVPMALRSPGCPLSVTHRGGKTTIKPESRSPKDDATCSREGQGVRYRPCAGGFKRVWVILPLLRERPSKDQTKGVEILPLSGERHRKNNGGDLEGALGIP